MKRNVLLCILFLSIFVSGCGKMTKSITTDSYSNSSSHLDQFNNPSLSTETYAINNDVSSLSGRTTLKNEVLALNGSSTGLSLQNTASNDLHLQLISELRSPVYQGQTLQASDIYQNGAYTYVAYNTQGPEKLGGVQILYYDGQTECYFRAYFV